MGKKVTAAILVGGKGTRLKPAVSDVPKPMAPLKNGQPFLVVLINELKLAGISRIVMLSTEAISSHIQAYFQDGTKFGVEMFYSNESEPLGTGGAVFNARELLGSSDFLLINGDTFVKNGLGYMLKAIKAVGLDVNPVCQMLVVKHANANRYGLVDFDSHSQCIKAFDEKPKEVLAGYINAGVYYFSASFFSMIKLTDFSSAFVSMEKEVLPNLVNQKKLYAVPYENDFFDIGTPESYADFNQYVLNQELN